jgi:predicted PolB exonuclease-like 3'-5' exonuclease
MGEQAIHGQRNPLGETWPCPGYEAIGWNNKPALGLSIGAYYDYRDSRIHWFDEANLEETVEHLVALQPLMVSFNGIAFDFPLMRGILRREQDEVYKAGVSSRAYPRALHELCDKFKLLAAQSYDILAEIWKADPARKFERGLNSLDAIAQANGLGAKLSNGAQAPRDWAAARRAEVLNYCQDDVYKTMALFEMICTTGQILRGDDNPIRLPIPAL